MYTSIITYLLVNNQDVLLDKIITKELLINTCMSLLIVQISINKSSISYHHVHVSWALFHVIYVATINYSIQYNNPPLPAWVDYPFTLFFSVSLIFN